MSNTVLVADGLKDLSFILTLGTCSFICQGTSTRRQRKNLLGLRVKLPPVTSCLTAQSPHPSHSFICAQAHNQKQSTGEEVIFLTGEGAKVLYLLPKLMQGFYSVSCSLG